MSRHILARGFTMLRPKSIANELIPEFSSIQHARMASTLDHPYFTRYADFNEDLIRGWKSKLKSFPKGTMLDLKNPKVMEVKTEDIELSASDKLGQITIASQNDVSIRYGEVGVSASESVKPKDLLMHELVIPSGVGVLDIEKHRPFLIDVENPDITVAITDCVLVETLDHKDLIKQYSISSIPMPEDIAKRLSIKLQDAIFSDRRNESFYEEVTSRVYQPTFRNRSSGTLMNFESDNYSEYRDGATNMHYHPGERSLLIIATKKPAGVTLNFCGIAENPDKRTDCSKRLQFPENSIAILNFPPYTHHKFHGDFVCMSIHPREGINLIEAAQLGTLPKGFLESATVFSASTENQKKWEISLPQSRSAKKDRSI